MDTAVIILAWMGFAIPFICILAQLVSVRNNKKN